MDKNLIRQAAAYRLDGALVERGDFYRVACDPQRSVVVEACAGAGKTWMLVSRILRALLDGTAPQEIVAITFTRKAAGEMRDRLGEWLSEFSAARSSAEERIEALQARGMSAAQAREAQALLGGLHAKLLGEGRSVEIRTFHAWFSQLLRAAPLDLLQSQGLTPELQLVEDESDLMPDLWQRFHEHVLGDAELLSDYRAMVVGRGRSTLMRWLEAAFSKRVELRLADAQGLLETSMPGADSVDPVFAGLGNPIEALRLEPCNSVLPALARVLGGAKGATAQKSGMALEQGLSLSDDSAAFEAVRKALFTAAGSPRKNLGEHELLAQAFDLLDKLVRAVDQQAALQEHLRLVRLSRVLLDEYEDLKAGRGLVDMNDLERGALALLANSELAGWVQERLDARVRHVLIDEFQDTSPLQWHALYAWLSSYSGAGGGFSGQHPPAVFIVGDPKQSIYRFRRAEPRVFAAAREFVLQGLGGAVLECDHTRRNAPAVLEAVNCLFDAIGAQGEFDGFRLHTTEVDAGLKLSGLYALPDPQEPVAVESDESLESWRPSLSEARFEAEEHRRAAEAQTIAEAVLYLVQEQGVAPGEIFILARRREPLRVLALALKRLGLPHAAPEDSALLDAPDVRDLLALLDALASHGQTLSLAHVLRSPLFAVDESDLLALSDAASAVRISWWEALMRQQSGSQALLRARQLLQRWSDLAQRLTPHDLLDRIVFEGDLMARIVAAVPHSECRQRLAAVDALLEAVLDLDGGRYVSLYNLVRALKQRKLKLSWPSEADAVQLLTVHGAKGLEAPVVFLMDTDAAPARAESATLAVDWPVHAAAPEQVAFLASEARCPPSLSAWLELERQQRAREELNALYVAMTRARSLLLISRTPNRKENENSWWARLSPLAQPWPVEHELAQRKRVDARQGSLLVLPTLQVLPTPRAEMAEADRPLVPMADTAALGEALHRVLEWACAAQRQDLSLDLLAQAAARSFGLSETQQQGLLQAARAILTSEQCTPFFETSDLLWAGNEVAIHHEGQDLRMDRLVCRLEDGRKTWWVIDYKLHPAPQQDESYREQLTIYAKAVQRLQPHDEVRCAFITGQGRLLELEYF